MDTIFKVGDKVYDYNHGWGIIRNISNNKDYPIEVEFLTSTELYTLNGIYLTDYHYPSLSFTEYDFINGGFSQKRPLPNIKKDTLVYVRNSEIYEWQMRYFSHFDNQRIFCFDYQRKSTENFTSISSWEYYSIENPLLKEK